MMLKMMQAFMPAQKMIDMFSLKITSNQPIETITEKVSAACENYKFALLQTYVYHEIVESKGFPIKRKVYIYEVCQAKVASDMLTTNPDFSIFMPCKLAIYEDGGKVVISTMNMDIMLKAVSANKELHKEATNLFGSLKLLMSSLSNI